MKDLIYIENKSSEIVLVFLPGGPGLHYEYLYDAFLSLNRHANLIFYNPGYSLSFKINGVDDLFSEFVEHIYINFRDKKEVYLVGHSGGGALALEINKRLGDKFKLILMSYVFNQKWKKFFLEKNSDLTIKNEQICRIEDSCSDSERLKKKFQIYGDYYFTNFDEKASGYLNKIKLYAGVEKKLQHWLGDIDFNLYINSLKIKSSILSICGSDDRVIYPEYYDELNLTAKNHKVVMDGGHFPFYEQQEKVIDLIINYITEKKNGGSNEIN